ncbi:MAG: hypothetical protein SFT68_04750, partial [Rickettsiaceae bacterium]|nr:hypothetical protein [Rickettsiaceae bacterium]
MNYIESSANKNIEKLWIIISILSLALGGLYSIFIVLLRTPFVSEFFLNKSIFKTSLIIHVDLTVLFWLTSFMMMIMSSNFVGFFARTTQNLQYIIIFSILLISASPAVSSSTPFLNNYVPVLHNFLFIVGLGLFFSCFVVIAIFAIISGSHISIPLGILSLMICISFGDSAYKLGYASDILDQSHYYELLFWGCGHLLQFLYISGLIIIWYSPQISEASKNTHSSIRVEYLIYLNCMIVIFPLLIQLSMDIENSYYIYLFTEHMKIFGAVSFLICLIDAAVYQFFAKQAYQ